MNCILSIGLNVGDAEPAAQLGDTLAALPAHGIIRAIAMGASQWNGMPERFLQVQMETPGRRPENVAAILARELRQEAIAVLRPNGRRWALVGHDGLTVGGASVAEFPCLIPGGA